MKHVYNFDHRRYVQYWNILSLKHWKDIEIFSLFMAKYSFLFFIFYLFFRLFLWVIRWKSLQTWSCSYKKKYKSAIICAKNALLIIFVGKRLKFCILYLLCLPTQKAIIISKFPVSKAFKIYFCECGIRYWLFFCLTHDKMCKGIGILMQNKKDQSSWSSKGMSFFISAITFLSSSCLGLHIWLSLTHEESISYYSSCYLMLLGKKKKSNIKITNGMKIGSLIQDAKWLALKVIFRHSYCVSGIVNPSPFTDPIKCSFVESESYCISQNEVSVGKNLQNGFLSWQCRWRIQHLPSKINSLCSLLLIFLLISSTAF